ncbi:MAG: Holliday junction resolvase RuvX [Clostridia bacterium]|nr:Holliday junction resolvase RuvX [Clostridia bacterium]
MTPRVLALDVGERRIGVAVSDPLGLTAQGVETIVSQGWTHDVQRIGELLALYETDRLLVGLPRSLSGDIGPQAQRILAFADQLTARGWQVRFQDERLTTSLAQRTLIQGDVRRDRRKQVVDKLAATYILQSFLDAGGWNDEKKSGAARVTDTAVWKGMKKMDTGENNSMEMDNIIELVDENDNPIRFEHIMTVQYEGEDYILLAPVDPTEDMEEDEVLVLKIDNDENGDEIYVSIEDDALVQKVFEKYLEIVESDEE